MFHLRSKKILCIFYGDIVCNTEVLSGALVRQPSAESYTY